MSVKRYFAATTRECLKQIKMELGADAIVVSNRAVPGGVEIMVMSSDSFSHLAKPGESTPAPAPAPAPRAAFAATPAATAPAASRPAPRLDPYREMSAAAMVDDGDYTVSISAKARAPQPQAPARTPAITPAAAPRAAPQPQRPGPAPLMSDSRAPASDATHEFASQFAAAQSQQSRLAPQRAPMPRQSAAMDPLSGEDERQALARLSERFAAASKGMGGAPDAAPQPAPAQAAWEQDASRSAAAPATQANQGRHASVLEPLPPEEADRAVAAGRPLAPAPRASQANQASQASEQRPALRPLPQRGQVESGKEVAATLKNATSEITVGDTPALMKEMRSIKHLIERQLAGFAWREINREEPIRAQLLGEMLEAGFSTELARQFTDALPPELAAQDARKWLAVKLNSRLRVRGDDADIIDRGGVFAIVGPTGVGKTTTAAKLAARCVVRHGADRLALLTTDTYRIGAHEQLRTYGRILGVPVYVVRDAEDLRRTLADLADKHMILIDTVGMSQRDRMVAEQAAMLTRAGEVSRLLLLNASSRGDTLDDVINAYAGEDLAGCILTKIDEAVALAPAVDAVVRHGLSLAYVSNGQRVPEDLHLPNRNYLLHRSFKQAGGDSSHRLRSSEIGLVLPAVRAEDARREAALA